MFPQSEGALDRVIRLVVGVGVGVAAFTVLTGVRQMIAAIVAAIPLPTAVSGFCLIYAMFRGNTRHKALSGSV